MQAPAQRKGAGHRSVAVHRERLRRSLTHRRQRIGEQRTGNERQVGMRESRQRKDATRPEAGGGVHRRSPRGLQLEGPRRLQKNRGVGMTAEV
jgi:hypothetical protein